MSQGNNTAAADVCIELVRKQTWKLCIEKAAAAKEDTTTHADIYIIIISFRKEFICQ